jgi:uncharacterized protein (DUF1684 family)
LTGNLSLREVAIETSKRSGFVGTPGQVADELTRWVRAGVSDGFNISPYIVPGGLDEIVDWLVPELQERGVYRTAYASTTLRGHLGLREPLTRRRHRQQRNRVARRSNSSIRHRKACIMTIIGETAVATFEAAWNEWHTERERYFADPLGWVSVTGLYWLTDEFETVADLPGRWRADVDAVYVEGIDGTEKLKPAEGAPGLLVEDGDRRIEVIRRTGAVALRVHDPKSPHLPRYNGIPAYLPSEHWRVTGTFTPFDQPKIVTTGAVVEGLEHHHNAVGVIDFELAGAALQLVAFGRSDGGLHALFTDATSGVTTYPGARSLPIAAPDADGTVALDFNRASNLPCSFTDFATCPVAPAENRLTVAVEAGEKNPR